MNSNHPREMLSAYLDGELTAEETAVIEEHLASCEECRVTLEIWRSNDKLITGIVEPASSEMTAENIMDTARRSSNEQNIHSISPQSRTAQFVAFAMAAAAALMLCFRIPWDITESGPEINSKPAIAKPIEKPEEDESVFENDPYSYLSVDISNNVSVTASAPIINNLDMVGNLNVGLNVEPMLNQYEVILLRAVTADEDEDAGAELLNIQKAAKNSDLLTKTQSARAFTISAPDYDEHLRRMEMLLTRIYNVDESSAKDEAPAIQKAISSNDLIMRNGQLRNALQEYNEKVNKKAMESQSK